jgi:hypothetical protein
MATNCFIPILGKRIRVTRLDECCFPPEAETPDAVVVTNGFISVGLTTEIESGTEILTRRADGSICVNERTNDSFTRFTVDMNFCGVDPDLLSIMTNAQPYSDYDDNRIGVTVGEGELSGRYSLELWTGLANQPCEPGAEAASGYALLPGLSQGVWQIGDIAGDSEIDFSLTGSFTTGGNGWGVGPYNIMLDDSTPAEPAPLPTALDPGDHLLLIETGLAPPPGQCGAIPMPAAA